MRIGSTTLPQHSTVPNDFQHPGLAAPGAPGTPDPATGRQAEARACAEGFPDDRDTRETTRRDWYNMLRSVLRPVRNL